MSTNKVVFIRRMKRDEKRVIFRTDTVYIYILHVVLISHSFYYILLGIRQSDPLVVDIVDNKSSNKRAVGSLLPYSSTCNSDVGGLI